MANKNKLMKIGGKKMSVESPAESLMEHKMMKKSKKKAKGKN